MAASAWELFGYGKSLALQQEINLETDAFKAILIDEAWTPNLLTDEMYADISGDETANGNGYTTGGQAVSGVTLSYSAGVTTWDCDDIAWTPSGGAIEAAYIVIYDDTHADDPLIAVCTLASGSNVSAETQPLQVTIHADGVWTA